MILCYPRRMIDQSSKMPEPVVFRVIFMQVLKRD
jgi:hypothetical protein